MTPGRLRRDESGVALALVVIMIVLIGVMAAGLLTIVRSDLEAVIEANQGERALSLADAGVQAARGQLRSDAEPEHYDTDRAENANWAYVAPAPRATAGETLTLDDGSVRVRIQYLLPSTTTSEVDETDHAPELTPGDPPGPYRYFKVTSEGMAGGARRKVEAILYARKIDGQSASSPAANLTTRPGLYEVRLWSWRELYE